MQLLEKGVKYIQIQQWRHKNDVMTSQKQAPEFFHKKGVFKICAKLTGKDLCLSLFFNKVAVPRPKNVIKKETPTQVFSCDFRKNFKNTSGRLLLTPSEIIL